MRTLYRAFLLKEELSLLYRLERYPSRRRIWPRISTRRPSWTVPIWPNTGSRVALRRL